MLLRNGDEIMQNNENVRARVMSIEEDKPGFTYPPIARKYEFMAPVNTMQATQPCECKSLSSGVATGVGIAVGAGLVVGTAWGIFKLLKR